MSQHRKHRGFRTERVVADYLREWWPFVTVGRGSGKDLHNVPFDIEVKARNSMDFMGWLRQVNKRASVSKELAAVVVRMHGQGESAEDYLAFMRFGDLVQLLIKAGYTDFQKDTVNLEPERCNECGAWIIKDSPCRTCHPLS